MARSKKSYPEFFRLIARIKKVRTMYLFAESDRRKRDDDLLVRLKCCIEWIDKKYTGHNGKDIDVTVEFDRRLNLARDDPEFGKPFMLGLNLRKNERTAAAYIPSDAALVLPSYIASGFVTHVEIQFEKLERGWSPVRHMAFSTMDQLLGE